MGFKNIFENPAISCLFISSVAVILYHFYQKNDEKNQNEEINYIFYSKIFLLVFIICFIGVYFIFPSNNLDDGFLNQKYETKCPELIPKKKFKGGSKKMRGPSISVDSLKLLSPISLKTLNKVG